jgi:diadenylate cyclase
MRHRAGLGISEQADVVSVIVSEETGTISIADNGVLIRGLSVSDLRAELHRRLSSREQPTARSIWKLLSANG